MRNCKDVVRYLTKLLYFRNYKQHFNWKVPQLMNKYCCITNTLELTSRNNYRTRQENWRMDSKLLVKFLCLWLVFNCILFDQVQSFTVRAARRRRNRGLTERRRDGRKRDSVFKREQARVSSVWVGCFVIWN